MEITDVILVGVENVGQIEELEGRYAEAASETSKTTSADRLASLH